MGTIEVYVGEVVALRNGTQQDTRRKVVFEGEKLGERTEYRTDTRGTTETPYRTSKGDLVVHIENWSKWQGEPNTETLVKATEDDLQPGGRFYSLALACGLSRPMTLEEALSA